MDHVFDYPHGEFYRATRGCIAAVDAHSLLERVREDIPEFTVRMERDQSLTVSVAVDVRLKHARRGSRTRIYASGEGFQLAVDELRRTLDTWAKAIEP